MTLRGLSLALICMLPLAAGAAEPLGTKALESTFLKDTPPDTAPCKLDGSKAEGRVAGTTTACPQPPPPIMPQMDPKPETLLDRTNTSNLRALEPSQRGFDGRDLNKIPFTPLVPPNINR